MKCPNCGENLKGKPNFCGFCGSEVRVGDKQTETSILKKPISELFKSGSSSVTDEKQFEEKDFTKPIKRKETMEQVSVPKNDEIKVQDYKEQEAKQAKLSGDDFFNKPIDEIRSAQQQTTQQQTAQQIAQPMQPDSKSAKSSQPAVEKEVQAQKVESEASKPINPIIHTLSDDFLEEEAVKPNTVKVIDTVGQNKITAKSMLEYLGLVVEIQTKNSETIPYGDVITQDKEPGTKVAVGSTITLVTSVGTWTDWSTETIPEDKLHKFDVEEKIQYRSRTRQQTIDYKESSSKDEYPDYEIYEVKNVYSDWVEEDYYLSEMKENSDLCEVASKKVGFKYCGWNYKGSDEDIIESFGTARLAVTFNPGTTVDDWEYREIISKNDSDVSYTKWHRADDNGTLTPANDIVIANISIAGYDVGGVYYALKYGTKDSEWYKHRTREIVEHVYSFRKNVYTEWSEWGEWGFNKIEEDDLTDVETQKIYRYRRKASIK